MEHEKRRPFPRRFWTFLPALAFGLGVGIAHAGEPARMDSLGVAPPTATSPATEPAPAAAIGRAPERALFARRDLWLGLAAAGVVAAVATQDQWVTDEALESRTAGQRSLADAVRPLGSGGLVYSALAVGYGAARLSGHPAVAAQVMRVGLSIGVAGVCAVALKEVVGRERPEEAPNDSDELRPFSGHDSFPSGHTTVAFALASALDAETEARWVPWVAYPAAALVGWSRVHDERHWASDVFAGAVLGASVAAKTDRFLQERSHADGLGFDLRWNRGPELALTFRR